MQFLVVKREHALVNAGIVEGVLFKIGLTARVVKSYLNLMFRMTSRNLSSAFCMNYLSQFTFGETVIGKLGKV